MDETAASPASARAPGLFAPLTFPSFRFALGGRVLALTGGAAQAVTLALLGSVVFSARAGVVGLTGVLLPARRPIREITSG